MSTTRKLRYKRGRAVTEQLFKDVKDALKAHTPVEIIVTLSGVHPYAVERIIKSDSFAQYKTLLKSGFPGATGNGHAEIARLKAELTALRTSVDEMNRRMKGVK